ncbi:MAG TPA: adenine-specific DNA methylase [bacterium]|nr:adenine-specific DNA methylase [bacterium]
MRINTDTPFMAQKEKVNINRVWAMPNHLTFQIKPVRELIEKYFSGYSIDPFANSGKLASVTNDLDTSFDTDYNLDALDFLKLFEDSSVDTVLYDPPYSPRQVSESYKKLGKSVNMLTTSARYWSAQKIEIARIVKPGGIVISCSWNSGGIGKKLGFEIQEILLVAHGGWHNDTIITVERKQDETNIK